MAREVTYEATGPVRLDENDLDDEYGDVAVCMCGLSDERPFCDGSHPAAEDETDEDLRKRVRSANIAAERPYEACITISAVL